jgi:hypothetical protein
MGTIHAVQLKRICSVRFDLDSVGILPTGTKRWYRLDGRLGWSYPSSPTAWSRKYLPDGSSKSSISAGLDKPDDELGMRTDGQPLRGPHPHSRVSGEAVGARRGPAGRFPRAEAGGPVATTPSITSLSRSAARGSESWSCAASPKYPSHPNCWYSPVGRFYSPHSNVI